MFNFKSKKSFFGVLTLSASLVLSGCQSGSLGGSNSDVDSRLTSGKQAEFFSKSGMKACATGAVLGAGTCLLTNSSNKAACAAIAAVAACGVLMGTNYYLEQQRTTYANKEDRLNAYLADINKNTDELKAVSNSAKAVLADNQKTLASLDKQLKNKTIQKDQAKAQLKGIDSNIAYLQKQLKNMKESEQNWQKVAKDERASGMKTQQLESKISAYKKQISALETQVTTLAKQRSAIDVG